MAVEIGQRHDALVLHRHQHRVRHAVRAARARDNAPASNFAISTTVPPKREGREEHDQRGVRVERRRQQRHAVGPVAVGRAAQRVHPAHAVRLHDAFRRAGRARRVDDVERRVGR